ncbi:MAG: Sec-independent protein translocase subunit TatA/TatB [Chloroflexota bacterium]
MNFLGLGPGEIFVILLLALIVFGPGKLPEIGSGIGKAIREFRKASDSITQEFTRELSLDAPPQESRPATPSTATAVAEEPHPAATVAEEPPPTTAQAAEEPHSTPEPIVEEAGQPEPAPETAAIAPEPAAPRKRVRRIRAAAEDGAAESEVKPAVRARRSRKSTTKSEEAPALEAAAPATRPEDGSEA